MRSSSHICTKRHDTNPNSYCFQFNTQTSSVCNGLLATLNPQHRGPTPEPDRVLFFHELSYDDIAAEPDSLRLESGASAKAIIFIPVLEHVGLIPAGKFCSGFPVHVKKQRSVFGVF